MTESELRGLDARVHREVMGVVWDRSRCRICGWPIVREGEAGCWECNCSLRPLPERRADEAPHYSTDIAAAWRVVEKLRERWRVDLFVKKPGELVACCIEDRPWYGETVPIAICRAALECVKGVQS